MAVVAKEKPRTSFGTRLRSLREAAGLTQAELAERAEMLPHALARLERGEREPTWPTVLKLAEALEVGTDAFQEPDDDKPATSKRPRKK